jgi:hypothetical protein
MDFTEILHTKLAVCLTLSKCVICNISKSD